MSREIKFRAWLKEPKIMAEVKGSTTLENKIPYSRGKFVTEKLVKVEQNENINALWWCYERDDGKETECEIMQYTGFKDCKSVDIFEGDIVKYTTCDFFSKAQTKREFYGFVYFSRGAFRVKTKKLEFNGENSDLLENRRICEVIGNIYDGGERSETGFCENKRSEAE